jgi:hypothetical protein
MCSIADTGYNGYLCIAHTQYCTYLHRSSIADTDTVLRIPDTAYTHTLKNITLGSQPWRLVTSEWLILAIDQKQLFESLLHGRSMAWIR